jgi:hypothetical protein
MTGRLMYAKAIIVVMVMTSLLLTGEDQGVGEEISNIGLGHFTGRALSPSLLLRPGIAMVQMPVKPKGTWTIGLEGSWGNIWNDEPGSYTIDCELIRVEPRLTYTLLNHCEIGVFFPISGRIGGFADGFIEGFHEFHQLTNASRDKYPRDRCLIEVTNKDGNRIVLDGNSWGINDLPIFASVLLTEGTTICPAVSVQLTITVPVGDDNELQGLGTPVYEIGTMLSKRLGASRFVVYLGGSLSYCSKKELIRIPLREIIYNGLVTMEYQCGSGFSVLAQYFISSPPARNFYELSKPINELNLGFKWSLTESLLLELSIMENLFNYSNSTDIGMSFGLTQSW